MKSSKIALALMIPICLISWVVAAQPDETTSLPSTDLQWRDLQQKANQLKEGIFREKERIRKLQEVISDGTLGLGSALVLVHRNEFGSGYRLLSATYTLDGQTVPTGMDEETTASTEAKEFYSSALAPGRHRISVVMILQGSGYGLFPYAKGYRFKVKSSFLFDTEPGKLITIGAVGFERDFTTVFEEKPGVRYELKSERLSVEKARRRPHVY